MNYVRIPLTIGVISLLTIVGCSQQQAETPVSSTPEIVKQASSGAKDFTNLLGIISNTAAAVNTGDFTKAKAEFSKFEDSWKLVEDGVKAKSRKTYDAIEESLDKVNNSFKSAQPDKKAVLDALKSLQEQVTSTAKS
jgi:predicted nucleotide-binding protein